jgi:hypothetical protein
VALLALGATRITFQHRTEEVGYRLEQAVKGSPGYEMVNGCVWVSVNLHDTPPTHHLSHERTGQETKDSSDQSAMGNG